MKKLFMFVVACAATMAASADEDPLAGYTKYYWNNPDGGDWMTASNWVMADGSTATDYPDGETDAALFYGLNCKKRVSIAKHKTLSIGGIWLMDGCTSFSIGNDTAFNIGRLVRDGVATMTAYADGNWNHGSPSSTYIYNISCLLFGGDGFIPGAVVTKDGSRWDDLRSMTVDGDCKLVFNTMDTLSQKVDVWSSQTLDKYEKSTFFYGKDGDGRPVWFHGNYVLTVPSGQIAPCSNGSHVGFPLDAYQGTIDTAGAVLFFWPYMGGDELTCFRSKIIAPSFVSCGWSTSLLCDDHSAETCDYFVPSGTLKLGDCAAEDLTATCKLGAGDVNVSWSGAIDVQCAGALENTGAIRMTSYRGQGEKWGKVSMGVSDTVFKVYLDGKSLKRGTYGATGSGADNIDDVHFAGAGVLTVLKDDVPGIVLVVK